MKDFILNNIAMIDILDKYGIKHNRYMFSCPFHGNDKNPSAKAYENSFFCFTCGKSGDTIRFVEYYFNLSFQEAMQKINQDFNLGFSKNYKIDYNKIKEIQEEREKKQEIKRIKEIKHEQLCKDYRYKNFQLDKALKEVNVLNWENKISEIAKIQNKLELLSLDIDKIEEELVIS